MPLDPEQIAAQQAGGGANFLPGDMGGSDNGDPLGGGNQPAHYTTYVAPDGPHGANLRPGTVYQVNDTTGNWSTTYTPPSGGGGTTVINTPIQAQGGRYTTQVDTTGAITGIPGAVYQQDTYDGSITIVSKPAAQAAGGDLNGDGFNDKTGLPEMGGVSATVIGGKLYFQGQRIHPDGSPLTPQELAAENGTGGGNEKTWTGQGPKGYGTYYLDGAGGTPGTFIGDTRAPSAAVSSGTPRVSSGSSGGSSGSSAALSAQISADAAAARQAADQAFQQQQAADGRLYSAQQAQLDRQLRAAEDAAQNEKDRAAIQNQRAQLALQATQQFQQAVSSTDPIAFAAFLAANGNISNGLANGQTALSDRALVPAANILQLLNSGMGLQDLPSHDANYYLNQGGTGTTNTGGGGLPTGGTGTTGGTGDTTGAGGATGTGGLPTSGGGSPQITMTSEPPQVYGQRTIGTAPSGGWEIDPTTGLPARDANGQMIWNPSLGSMMPTVTGGAAGFGNFDLGQQVGLPQTVGQRNNIANAAQNTYEQGVLGDQRAISVTNAQIQNALGTSNPAPAYPQITPAAYNTVNTAPAGTSGPLGVANGTHIDVATGRLVPNQPIPQATAPGVARMASGGHIGGLPTRNLVPTIVGDRHDNKVSGTEELAFLPPGAHVLSHEDTKRALGGATGLQRALKGGLPRADTGFSLDPSQLAYLQSFYGTPTQPAPVQDPYGYGYTGTYTGGNIGGYTQPVVTYAAPAYTAPAPVQQPVSSPAPVPVSSPSATSTTTATGGLPTSTGTTSSSSTPPLNTTPGPTVTTPSGTTTQLPSPPPAPTTNTTGGGLPTGTPPTTATTPPLTGTAQNAVNTLPSQYTSGNLVTPDNQAYVDYVRNLRTGVQYPNLNMYSVDYASIDPTVRDIYEKGLQDQFGIPQSSSQFEQQKYQLRGLPTGAASVTY